MWKITRIGVSGWEPASRLSSNCILHWLIKQEREEGAAIRFDVFTDVIRYSGGKKKAQPSLMAALVLSLLLCLQDGEKQIFPYLV